MTDTILPMVEPSATSLVSSPDEAETTQDEFAKQLQTIQWKAEQQKKVQDRLLSDRQSQIVEEQTKTDKEEDLERDEQRKANARGGYTMADLRRGVDLIEISNAAPKPQPSEQNGTENSQEPPFSTVSRGQVPQKQEKQGSLSSFLNPDPGAFVPDMPDKQASMTPTHDASTSPQNTSEQIVETQQFHKITVAAKNAQTPSGFSLTGITPVTGNTNISQEVGLETKIASALKQVGEVKGKHENTITKEAVTATGGSAQSEGKGLSQQSAKEAAVSQMFPETSLLDRVDQAKLTQRITNVFRSLAGREGTVRMKLHPEELGAVTLKMKTEDGKVTAKLETETETAKDILLENLEQLRVKLAQQNIHLDSFDVEVRPDFSENFQATDNQEQQKSSTKTDRSPSRSHSVDQNQKNSDLTHPQIVTANPGRLDMIG